MLTFFTEKLSVNLTVFNVIDDRLCEFTGQIQILWIIPAYICGRLKDQSDLAIWTGEGWPTKLAQFTGLFFTAILEMQWKEFGSLPQAGFLTIGPQIHSKLLVTL